MESDEVSVNFFNELNNDCIKSISSGNESSTSSEIIYTINDNIHFTFNGVGIMILSVFGVAANGLSVIVLTHPKLKSSLSTLLLGLTISDIFMIGTSFLIFSLSAILKRIQVFPYYVSHVRPHLLPWLLPIALTAQMSSVYFTIVITLERYIAVCLPLKARSICTRSAAKRFSLVVLLLSILFNIPRWFEYHTVPKLICSNRTIEYREAETNFRRNENYILYYVNWGYLVVLYLIPFTILVFFNIAIYRVAKQHRSRRTSMSPTTANNNANEDIQLAGMLLGIVITFLVCNMLALVINVMESFGIGDIGNLIPINNFLIICSSSSNFIFYFAFGTEFRKRLKGTLSIRPGQDPRKNSTSNVSRVGSTSMRRTSSYSAHQRNQRLSVFTIDTLSSNDKNNNGERGSSSSSSSSGGSTEDEERGIEQQPDFLYSKNEKDEHDPSSSDDQSTGYNLSCSQSTIQTMI